MKRVVVCALALACHWPAAAGAAEKGPKHRVALRGAEPSVPVEPGSFDGDLRDLPAAAQWHPGDPIVDRYDRRRREGSFAPAVAKDPNFRDPLLEVQETQAPRTPDAFATPDLSMAGQGFSGVYPPDTVGAVGGAHYIQMINGSSATLVQVYNKNGTPAAGPFGLESLWTAGGACASGLGDPIVLWDNLAQRWLLSEFAASGNHLCVYVSKTSNPVSGGWWLYDFATSEFPDYPHYGVWPDAYYVGTNESNPAAYALDRVKMLSGQAATYQRFAITGLSGFSFEAQSPASHDGTLPPPTGAPGYFVRHRDAQAHTGGGVDRLEVYEFHVDWANSGNSTFTGPTDVPLSAFDSALCGLTTYNCIPQPSTTRLLDPLREEVMFAIRYRNVGPYQSLVANFATDVNGNDRAGVRWFELRKTTGAWGLQNEGTFSAGATAHRWMGSAANDRRGNLGLGYSLSDVTGGVPPSVYYNGRLANDPAGTLFATETALKAATSPQTQLNRWGDYSNISVDPVDGCTFWYTTEYGNSPSWLTWIGKFKHDSCLRRSAADFDNSGTGDLAIYRGGAWLTTDFRSGAQTGVWTGTGAGCVPVAMDYDGDGKVDRTQLCNGAWHFYNADGSYNKGIWVGNLAGTLAVPADYDGDGKDDVVAFRNGAWFFYDFASGNLTSSIWTGPPSAGGVDPIPVPMDYDGDGTADLSVLFGGAWHFYNDNGTYNKGIWVGNAAGNVPVPADYDGNGTEDVVIWNAGAWHWYDFASGAYNAGKSVFTGAPVYNALTPLPAPLDYDGDGRVDRTVFSGGPWHFYKADGSYYAGVWTGGIAGDRALSRRLLP